MTFELLPNEMLLECFSYLHHWDTIYAFHLLNSRFNRLIQAIPLHFNFENIPKSTFDQIRKKLMFNPDIKRRILSLRLSNDGTCEQIQEFLSFFSFDEFSSLRSLTLIGVDEKNINRFESMLSHLPELHHLSLIDPDNDVKGELSRKRPIRIHTSPDTSICHLPLIFNIPLLTNLTVTDCSCRDLSQLFQYALMLKYLNAQNVTHYFPWTDYYQDFSNHQAIHLKQLIITQFWDKFENLVQLLKQTPNLEDFMLGAGIDETIANASHWERLITSSLPQLTNFKFQFFNNYSGDNYTISNLFQKFQSPFWREEHHWYTEYYCISRSYARICTKPYMLNTLQLASGTNAMYYNYSTIEPNQFDKVTEISFHNIALLKTCPLHFPNVTTLRLMDGLFDIHQIDRVLFETEFFPSLKKRINLSKLKYLHFYWPSKVNLSGFLLQIMKEAPKLSSLELDADSSSTLCFENEELRMYLNRMIKKLYITTLFSAFENDIMTKELCKVFSNLEELTCIIDETRYFLLVLDLLPNLSIIRAIFRRQGEPTIDWASFEDEARRRNALFRIQYYGSRMGYHKGMYGTTVTFWIGKEYSLE